MASTLEFAKISYGPRSYPVKPSDLFPIPETLDPSAPDFIDQVRSIFAMMSNAGGGHVVRGCKVSTWNGSVNLSANGVHVFYKDPDAKKISFEGMKTDEIVEVAKRIDAERTVVELGSVRTDQYGDGWKRAIWKE